ncbi:FGGY-family carbohydrate kinase [Acidiphilium sp.]|uniref:FGGY-family carbohydrate kinase n=1 Tax=Acidiphilium sp. TaxID=527 RepID=UPI003D06CF89
MTMTIDDAVIGIDVGTGSARAGVFDRAGRLLGNATRPIAAWRPHPGFIQQSSTDIWAAVGAAVREAVALAGPERRIRGIGFDATCSLVVLDADGAPLSVDPDGAPEQNIMLWADHRAHAEADAINAAPHEVLRYVGGRISLEMQMPKLLWLKHHAPTVWRRAAHLFDLPDYLTFRATGAMTRSLCSTVCKWTYLGHENRWDAAFFRAIGLGDLADEGFSRIGTTISPPGTALAAGLSPEAAAAFGLAPGVPVGTAAIDAHAGGIGVIGATLDGAPPDDAAFNRRLALIGGTSSCHMAIARAPAFVPGVWGPYFSAMVPEFWLNEGGQSATGALIDHVITTHAAYPSIAAAARERNVTTYQILNAMLDDLAPGAGPGPAALTGDLHVLPDFHGNRSPHADATLRGMITGLTLSATPQDCARLYLATIQAIAYGTREIITAMNHAGYAIDTIFVTGGGVKNPVFLREHADATQCRLVLPGEPEAVLLGAAMLGAVAGNAYPGIRAAMAAMSDTGTIIAPNPRMRRYHDRKYSVFQRLHADQLAYRSMMKP